MKISKTEIQKYYKNRKEEFLKEGYSRLPHISKAQEGVYLVTSEDKTVSAYVNFDLEDYEELGGPKLEKTDVVCYSISWDFTIGSRNGPVYWSNVTATIPAVIDIFMRDSTKVDVFYFKGMIGTSTGNEYLKSSFADRIETIFSDKFSFIKATAGAFPKFYLVDKAIKLTSDAEEIKKEVAKGKLTLQEVTVIYNTNLHPWKYKDNLKGIHKWNIVKEQIDRIILKKIYL